MSPLPPLSTLFPYTTLFRSVVLAWDAERGEVVYGYLAAAVRAFFRNGGRRCWIVRVPRPRRDASFDRSEEHTSELQSLRHLVCRLLLEKKKSEETTQITRKR